MGRIAKTAVVGEGCVSCGCCASVCPLGAVTIYKGLYAVVHDACVGCGKCAKNCPAGIITIEEKEAKTA